MKDPGVEMDHNPDMEFLDIRFTINKVAEMVYFEWPFRVWECVQ